MFANKIKITGMALLLASALSLTACSGGNADDNQTTPAPSATPTASASFAPNEDKTPITEPTEKPKVEKNVESDEMPAELRAQRQTVADIDLDYAFKNYSDSNLEKVFPAPEFDTKAGAEFGLNFMQDLINTQNFYMEREAGDDLEILTSEDFASRMDEGLLNDMRKDIKKDGRLSSIPTALLDGSLGEMDGEKWVIADTPTNKFNTPAVGTYAVGDGNALYVRGERTVRFPTTNGKAIDYKGTYQVSVMPSGDSWVVTGIGFDRNFAPKVVK